MIYHGVISVKGRKLAGMNIELTLQEKLKDLRVEKKLRLQDLADETGIPMSSLQRTEGQDDVRVGYQDLVVLAEYFDVSTDYLFGLTDNRKHRNVEVDKLRLSDLAIEVLTGDNFNHRLLSELISHPDFPQLMRAIEIYIDRIILPQMNTMNAMYKIAEKTIKDKCEVTENDEMITILGEAIVNEDEYLRFRITERFSALIKSLYDIHQKDVKPDEEFDVLNDVKTALENYDLEKTNEEKAQMKMIMLAKQLGLNLKDLTREEQEAVIRALEKSDLPKQSTRKRKRRR